jgi:dienelactone hydrolase
VQTLLCVAFLGFVSADPIPGTKPLLVEGDLAARMVVGIDKYLVRELATSAERRRTPQHGLDTPSPEDVARSIASRRERLGRILGVGDARVRGADIEYIATIGSPSLIAEAEDYRVYAVRWPVFAGVDAEGLLLEPKGKPAACIVALPDPDWTPEMLCGLAPGVPPEAQFSRRLAENGCRVLVPTLVNREDTYSGNPQLRRMTNQPHREFIYRMAYEVGRHVIGYEVQKTLAAVDWFCQTSDPLPVGVVGYGEGGLVVLASAALDPRIQGAVVSGYFCKREAVWQEPIYRNVWALLREFGDRELAEMVAPRMLAIECGGGPVVAGPPAPRSGRSGAAPGKLGWPHQLDAWKEANRHLTWEHFWDASVNAGLSVQLDLDGFLRFDNVIERLVKTLTGRHGLKPGGPPPVDVRKKFDADARQRRQVQQLVDFTQRLVREAESRRQEFFWSKVDTSSLESWKKSTRPLRTYFWEGVIGKLPEPGLPINPRTRQTYDEPKWRGHEVMLDLYPDVFAFGILLVPKDIKPGERRPVVVCQHGLEGRPQDVVNPRESTPYYHSFGAQLADRGFIVYAPQNPYIGQDKFRVLQRKANPLGLSLFSFIVRQQERTLDWLATLPFVDADRIGFYGLSYGGKTAMRVPAILERYALSICSGDFNEWIWKNARVDFPASYLFSGEYEMYEFNLGNTFNYAEMAALIAPRPFMVERGHHDGVGIDEWVAYEYAKVRRLYAGLKLPERTAIEFFDSGHEINGKGTFEFLEKHLKWPG